MNTFLDACLLIFGATATAYWYLRLLPDSILTQLDSVRESLETVEEAVRQIQPLGRMLDERLDELSAEVQLLRADATRTIGIVNSLRHFAERAVGIRRPAPPIIRVYPPTYEDVGMREY